MFCNFFFIADKVSNLEGTVSDSGVTIFDTEVDAGTGKGDADNDAETVATVTEGILPLTVVCNKLVEATLDLLTS